MSYDPNKPADNTPIRADEIRAQLAALKALIDALQAQVNAMVAEGSALAQAISALPTQAMVDADITSNSAANANSVQPMAMPGYPPTQQDVVNIVSKVNELITTVHR